MGGPVRARSSIVLLVLLVALAFFAIVAPSASAWTFDCTIRLNSSCLANETLLVRLNSSEAGSAPNNSHAQLANYSGDLYNYSVCCWTDTFRNLGNACTNTYTSVLNLAESNNSHVQAGNMTGYQYGACFNLTGTLACEYTNDACSSGYTNIVSIASSELAAANLTNAHVATPTFYKRQVCCAIINTIPNVTSVIVNSSSDVNSTAFNVTSYVTVSEPDQDQNLSLMHDWLVNGTPLLLVHLTFDLNRSDGKFRDYSYLQNNATNHINRLFWNATGGYNRTGAVEFNGTTGRYIYLEHQAPYDLQTDFTIDVWVKWARNTTTNGPLVTHYDSWEIGGWGMSINTAGQLCFYSSVVSEKCVTVGTPTNTWMHLAIARNGTNYSYYKDGTYRGSQTFSSISALTTPICIGAEDLCTIGTFNGTLDSVRIWNRSLTTQQVRALYENRTDRIVSQELRANQNWTDCVIANDGINESARTCSTGHLVVATTPPQKVNLTYPAHNNQSVLERFVNFSWTTAAEADGDSVNYTLHIVLAQAGACSAQATITGITTTNYTYGELCVDQLYNWTVSACDADGCSGNTTIHNFTIASVIGIRLAANVTDYGVLALLQNNATDITDGPSPLIIENNGNVYVNVTLNASQSPFSSVALGSTAFQYRVADNETASINATGSQTTYTPVPDGETHAVTQLNHSDTSDTVRIHTNITVPGDEPPGTKTTNLTFQATVAES